MFHSLVLLMRRSQYIKSSLFFKRFMYICNIIIVSAYVYYSCPRNVTQYLWCHEWLKHGTCASSIREMNTEHGYFSTVLSLYEDRMDFETYVLEKQNIYPSTDKPYQVYKYIAMTITLYYVYIIKYIYSYIDIFSSK